MTASIDITDQLATARKYAPRIARRLCAPLLVTVEGGNKVLIGHAPLGRIVARVSASGIWKEEKPEKGS